MGCAQWSASIPRASQSAGNQVATGQECRQGDDNVRLLLDKKNSCWQALPRTVACRTGGSQPYERRKTFPCAMSAWRSFMRGGLGGGAQARGLRLCGLRSWARS